MQSLLRAKLKKKEKGLEGFESPEFEVIMDVIASAINGNTLQVSPTEGSLEFTEKLFLLECDKFYSLRKMFFLIVCY